MFFSCAIRFLRLLFRSRLASWQPISAEAELESSHYQYGPF
jgi:hypothetical protein